MRKRIHGCRQRTLWQLAVLGILVWGLFAGCTAESGSAPSDLVLIRVGQQAVTAAEFEAAFSISQLAYEDDEIRQPAVWKEARQRLLNQMVEEALLKEKARAMGLQVMAAEVDRVEAQIRADYPEDSFEQTLLEHAVSHQVWRQRLATRLLIDKVVARGLARQVTITPEEMADLLADASAGGDPQLAAGSEQRLVEQLRRRKIEAVYPDWIKTLRETYPIDINKRMWEALLTANAT